MRIKQNINKEIPGHVAPTYESNPWYVTAGFKCDYCGFVTKSFGEWMPKSWRRFMFSPTKWKDACPACRDKAQREYDAWVDDVWTNPDIKTGTYGEIPGR